MVGIVSLLVAVVLGAPFGAATAAAIDDTDGLAVSMSVATTATFEAVIVRPFSTFEELPPTALRGSEDGTWSGIVVLPTAEDWFIVFEGIEPDGTATRSDTTTLTEFGVDPVVVAGEPEGPVSRSVDATTVWLGVGILFALGALGFLAWWTFAGGDGSEGGPPEGESVET